MQWIQSPSLLKIGEDAMTSDIQSTYISFSSLRKITSSVLILFVMFVYNIF